MHIFSNNRKKKLDHAHKCHNMMSLDHCTTTRAMMWIWKKLRLAFSQNKKTINLGLSKQSCQRVELYRVVCSIGIKYLKSDPILDLLFMTNTHFNNKFLQKKKKKSFCNQINLVVLHPVTFLALDTLQKASSLGKY